MRIERYRDQIDQLAPLVIDGSADLADVSMAELLLLVVELQEFWQRDAAQQVCNEISARVDYDGVNRYGSPWWEDNIPQALEEEARAAGQGG